MSRYFRRVDNKQALIAALLFAIRSIIDELGSYLLKVFRIVAINIIAPRSVNSKIPIEKYPILDALLLLIRWLLGPGPYAVVRIVKMLRGIKQRTAIKDSIRDITYLQGKEIV